MVLTKSDENILYEVDNQPVKDIYVKYLEEKIIKHMPTSAIKFQLIMHEGGVDSFEN
ncbi:hypothetical protein [Sulfurimonas sp.]|uniref:hypothetical protein n=1 Tax=Sulfurimonas sp. TaxID=2022749 RepID=UPI00356A46A6